MIQTRLKSDFGFNKKDQLTIGTITEKGEPFPACGHKLSKVTQLSRHHKSCYPTTIKLSTLKILQPVYLFSFILVDDIYK